MKEPLAGKKTYIVGVVALVLGAYQLFAPSVGLPVLDLEGDLDKVVGVGAVVIGTALETIRAAISKVEKLMKE